MEFSQGKENMAERIRMAGEGGTVTEAPRLVIANASGVVTGEYRPPTEIGAEAEGWLKEAAAKKQSTFQMASEVIRLASKFSAAELAEHAKTHPGFQELLTNSTRIINETFRPKDTDERRQKDLEKEVERVLHFVRDDIRRIYLEATQPTSKADSDSWYGSPRPKSLEEKLQAVDEALANYQERFWDYGETTLRRIFGENADLPALRQKYEGAASYLASKVAIAVGKELKGLPLEPGEGGDSYLADIKRELEATKGGRERIRREQRKRAAADERLHYSDWRERFDFSWAETTEELDDSVEDWLDYFQQALPREAEEAVYQEVQKGMTNALAALEKARNRIHLEANDARVQALREKIVGHVTTISGARLVESRNGFEYFIKLKTDFAANYGPYYDAIYLKRGFAIMADKLSENEGGIYRGGSQYFEKPLAGDTKTFRSDLERKAIRHAASHELYVTEADFEEAELGEREIRRQVAGLNLSFDEGQRMIKQEIEERRRLKELVAGNACETEQLDRRDIERVVERLNLPVAVKRTEIQRRMALRRETRARMSRYGWEDGIEELLLGDSRGLAKARALTDPVERDKAIERVRVRTRLWREMKDDLDKQDITEEEKAAGITQGLFGLSSDQRKDRIRQRIEDKMKAEGNQALLDEINRTSPDQTSRDRALWKWVRDYNRPRIELRREGSSDEPWFPSLWDGERLSMTRPEDLIDRALSKDEFKAMVEEVDDTYKGLTEEQIQRRIRNEFRREVQGLVVAKRLSPEGSEREFNRLMEEREEALEVRIGDVLFERKQRQDRAIRNYNLNIAQDKFLELQARWGGLTTRWMNPETGKFEMRTIFSLAAEMLKAKIDTEERQIEDKVEIWRDGFDAVANRLGLTAQQHAEAIAKYRREYIEKQIEKKLEEWRGEFLAKNSNKTKEEIEKAEVQQKAALVTAYESQHTQQIEDRVRSWREGYLAAHPGLTDEQKEAATIQQRRLFRRNATFAATLGLRELGIAHDLPIWNYYYYSDVSQIGAFAPLVGYTHDDKGILPELLDRSRREMEAVFSFLADKYLDKKMLVVVDYPGLVKEDEDGAQEAAHDDKWVRPRVINEGGVLKLRDLFEARMMISTSGGVKVADLISRIADLGVYDELWENGCKDKREWQGFRKRRNRHEFRQQSFLNTREWADPITHVQRLAGAAAARRFLV